MKQFVHLSACMCLILSVYVIGRAQKPELAVQTGHSAMVSSVTFSPDGKTLASASEDRTIILWDATTGAQLRTLKGHSAWVRSVAFTPDGKTLASGSSDYTVKLWDVTTGLELRTLKGHSSSVETVVFNPDGKTLASGSNDETIKLWDVARGTLLHTLAGHVDRVFSVAFSPDGKTLASGSGDETIKLWDVIAGSNLRTLTGHYSHVIFVAFSPDGRTLISGGGGVTLSSNDDRHTFLNRPEGVKPGESRIKRWDVTTGTELPKLEWQSYSGHEVALSHDGNVITSERDERIKLWDFPTGRELHTLNGDSAISSALSPNGKMLASGRGNGEIKLWDVATGAELRTLKKHLNFLGSVAFSPDGKTLVGIYGTTIKLWDIATGGGSHKLKLKDPVDYRYSGFGAIAFSPDSKRLAVSTEMRDRGPRGHLIVDGAMKLFDVATGAELLTLDAASVMEGHLAFSPDGKLLAGVYSVGGYKDIIYLCDVVTGITRMLNGSYPDVVRALAFSSDGTTLVIGSNHLIEFCDVATGTVVRTLGERSSLGEVIAFSRDNKIMASKDKGTIKLLDVNTGTELHTLEGYLGTVRTVTFSPDGKILASVSQDNAIKLWDTTSGKEIATLFALDDNDWAVVTPDGLFDGSPDAWNRMIWRAPQNTFDYASVEAYFSDFYYPGLLADIFASKRPKAPSDIAQKDRRQPEVKLSLVSDGPSGGSVDAPYVQIKVGVTESPAGKDHRTGSGAQDVRLFRNGTLVRLWRGDVLKGKSSVTLGERIPIVAGENRFTAYAFNRDNVKSADAALAVRGAESLKRPAKLYLLAVGINRYANTGFNLRYAVADAEEFGGEWQPQQARVGRYAETVVVPLLDEEATKANILLAIKRLVEIETTTLPASAPKQLGELKYANPEDGVVIYFAGHGTAQQSRFYLIPHDLGYKGKVNNIDTAGLATLLAHSISDRELEEAFERLNAGQLLMVLDACNSGQALEAEEKRRGPMNSKGLAQLAYEKGMYILTAAQSFQAAQEASQLGHGLLTYALIEEGLKRGEADGEPKDGTVLVREWLDYATERVPQMQINEMKRALSRGMNLSFKEEERGLTIEQRSGQRPRVFYRRELEAQPLVVAKPAVMRLKN